MERKYKGWIIERMEDGHYNMRPEDVEQWTDAAERLKDAKAMIDRMTEQKGNETMSKIETVEVTAETINKELVKAVKTDAKVARKLVLEVHPFAANIIWKETNGAWPEKSLTVGMIDASQTLQDMFVGLTPSERSLHVRDIKFVSENFDAVVTEGETNGWRKIDAMRKAIQKAQKAEEKASQEATEDTEEATEGTTEGATEEATEEVPTISINDIMSAIMRHIPEATNAQLLAVAEELDPLPRETKELTVDELLESLGMNENSFK